MHKGRMEAFSDGVIAIIITIMVLEFKIPHEGTFEALRPLAHTFISYILSFVYVGIYWNNHHHMMQAATKVSGGVLWANLHLLFWLSLIPFTTGWMGEHQFSQVPVVLYGFVLLMCGAAYTILARQLINHHGKDSTLAKAIGRDFKGWLSLVGYLVAIALSFVHPWISYAFYIAVAVMWLVPDRRIEREMKHAAVIFALLAFGVPMIAEAKDITTNEVTMDHAPDWLTQSRVEKVTDRMQQKLEWTIRKIKVHYYASDLDFQKSHSLGPNAISVTTGQGDTVTMHLGPLVTNAEFDEVFGHELTHVIVLQKYKGAIPAWFEEGLANHYGGHAKVDYQWLARQPAIADVKTLAHPMRGSVNDIRYRYKASQALAEMLDKKCELENLIRLSVQRKMEDYIVTYCEIPDLNVAFKAWVAKNAK